MKKKCNKRERTHKCKENPIYTFLYFKLASVILPNESHVKRKAHGILY